MKFTRYQTFVVAVFGPSSQFTVVLDFMILLAAGRHFAARAAHHHEAIRRRGFGVRIQRQRRGHLGCGLRRQVRFASGSCCSFTPGSSWARFLCGIAPSYEFLFVARMVTGLFGGVIGSISFAIIADLFPFEARGRVMGFVMTAFSASQVLGIPLGLYLSNHWGLARAVSDDS